MILFIAMSSFGAQFYGYYFNRLPYFQRRVKYVIEVRIEKEG
jgi:hypothetical protein